MHHDIASAHRGADTIRVANVAGENLDGLFNSWVCLVEPAPRIEAVVVNEGPHVCASTQQMLCQVRPNKAVRAGHQYPLAFYVYAGLFTFRVPVRAMMPCSPGRYGSSTAHTSLTLNRELGTVRARA